MKTTNYLVASVFTLLSLLGASQSVPAADDVPTVHATGAILGTNDISALKDPKRIVRLRFRDPDFGDLAKNFTEADLPAFFEILDNDDTPFREKSIATELIPHICPKGDDQVVAKLVDFLRRPVKWENWATNDQDSVKVVLTKNNSIQAIHIVGGSKAEAVLRHAITAAGAEDLAKAWISGWPTSNRFGSRQDILDDLRGTAAYQLAFRQAHWELLQTEYARERQNCIESGMETRYFSNLIVAMAMIDAIKEVGTLPDPRLPSLVMQYRKKYKLPDMGPSPNNPPSNAPAR